MRRERFGIQNPRKLGRSNQHSTSAKLSVNLGLGSGARPAFAGIGLAKSVFLTYFCKNKKKEMRISKEQTCAVVVDMQEKLFPHIHDNAEMAKNSIILIQGLRHLRVPTLVTQQYSKGLGETIVPIQTALGHLHSIEKKAFSCWDEPNFRDQLGRLDPKFVLIMGMEAHVCVMQTAIDLKANGYEPVVVKDCVSSRKPMDRRVAFERLAVEGVLVATYESILFELCRVSGNSTFKAISRLVK